MILSTIGYQSAKIEEFFQVLVQNKVRTIIDIREYPISRKKGFSKTALARQSEAHKIQYIHIGALGCPRDIRHDYRKDQDWVRYSQRFLAYLKTQSKEVDQLAALIQCSSSCLLCFEADPEHCHRLYVAEEVSSRLNNNIEIKHLEPVKTMGVASPLS